MLITCPSGLSFEARKWKLGDRKVLLDKTNSTPIQRRALELVSGHVVSAGPYKFGKGEKVNWVEVASPDFMTALVQIRAMTKQIYEYDVWCNRCNQRIELSQDLAQIPVKPMSQTCIDHIATNAPIILKVGDAEVHWRVIRGSDLPRMENIDNQAEMAEVASCLHIAKIVTSEREYTDMLGIRSFYADADWEFQRVLTDASDLHEGGVTLEIDVRCKTDFCGAVQTQLIQLGIAFFDPSMEPRRSSASR